MKLCTPQDFEGNPLESQIYMARVSYVNSLCVDYLDEDFILTGNK